MVMAKKFEIRWIYDGMYLVDTIEANSPERAVSDLKCCFNIAKEYQILSVKEIKEDKTMKKSTKKSNKKLYVAYGSNLHLNQMYHRCPDAKVYGCGVLKNHELTFWGNCNRNGVATVLPGADTDVPVGVWEISERDEQNLDVYEGWPHLYRKEYIEVVMQDGSVVTAMVYIMNKGHMYPTKPSDYYYDTIATGYKSFGFNLDFLKSARDKVSELNHSFSQIW